MANIPARTNDSELYRRWHAMMQRCYHDTQDSYKYYSGRGIAVCDRWHEFENFYKDMVKTHKKGLSLDRIDNDKGYSPDNCRWATAKQQARNTTRNRFFTIDGKTKNLSAWIEETDIKTSTVKQRYYVMGWDIKDALFTPKHGRRIVS